MATFSAPNLSPCVIRRYCLRLVMPLISSIKLQINRKSLVVICDMWNSNASLTKWVIHTRLRAVTVTVSADSSSTFGMCWGLNEHTFSVFDIPPVGQGAKKLNELDCSLTCNLKQSGRFHHLVHPPLHSHHTAEIYTQHSVANGGGGGGVQSCRSVDRMNIFLQLQPDTHTSASPERLGCLRSPHSQITSPALEQWLVAHRSH